MPTLRKYRKQFRLPSRSTLLTTSTKGATHSNPNVDALLQAAALSVPRSKEPNAESPRWDRKKDPKARYPSFDNVATVPMPSLADGPSPTRASAQRELIESVSKHFHGSARLAETETLVYFLYALRHKGALLRPPFELATDAVREITRNRPGSRSGSPGPSPNAPGYTSVNQGAQGGARGSSTAVS
jgi:hypothetical protein